MRCALVNYICTYKTFENEDTPCSSSTMHHPIPTVFFHPTPLNRVPILLDFLRQSKTVTCVLHEATPVMGKLVEVFAQRGESLTNLLRW